MTSALYAVIAALLLFWLTLQVIKQRRGHKVTLGDGGNADLKGAIGAHSNALDSIPIFLILLFALEYNGGHLLLVHALGIVFMAARLIHARALLTSDLKLRVIGMHLTLWPLLALAVFNLLYLPYGKIFGG